MSNSVLAKMAVQIAANTAQFNAQMAAAQKTNASFIQSINKVGAALGITFGAQQLFNGISFGVQKLAGFEYQMDTVAAITGATGREFKELEKNALDLGKATEYTAKQVGELQTEYGRLGFSTQEILNSTKATIDLATATGSNLARSAEIAGSTLRGFQLDASEMGRVTDVMASSFNKSALGLDNFAESIKYVSPVAKSVNVSLEETTAMLGVLADAGIKGSQAGTSLRRIFTQLTADGRPLAERMDELAKKGISLADANDEVGLYAQTALLVLASQKQKVDELTASLQNANGETAKAAAIMRDNLIGDWNKFTAAIEGSILQGRGFANVLREIVQLATSIIAPTDARITAFANNLAVNSDNLEVFREKLIQAIASGQVKKEQLLPGFREVISESTISGQKLNQIITDLVQKAGEMKTNLSATQDVDPFTGLSQTGGVLFKKTVELTEAQKRAMMMAAKYKEELEKLRHTLANLAADQKLYAEISDRQMGLDAESELSKMFPFGSGKGFKPNELDDSGFFDKSSLEEFFKSEQDLLNTSREGWDTWYKDYSQRQEDIRNQASNTASIVANLSQGFGEMFATMSDESERGARAFGKASADIVDAIGRTIMAQMIQKAIQDKTTDFNFFAKLALIGIATGVASSLLRRIGKSSSSAPVSSQSFTGNGFRQESLGQKIVLEGEFKISGRDLKAVISNQDRYDGRTKAG